MGTQVGTLVLYANPLSPPSSSVSAVLDLIPGSVSLPLTLSILTTADNSTEGNHIFILAIVTAFSSSDHNSDHLPRYTLVSPGLDTQPMTAPVPAIGLDRMRSHEPDSGRHQ